MMPGGSRVARGSDKAMENEDAGEWREVRLFRMVKRGIIWCVKE
jgi:hypothetical protein